ncbi:ATP-binding protein [Pseudooceanicola sp. C21-150M6]|uniref:hybrid sensor histidine kinase/response regulator n=1 Tax=Pseudooceanicola sp. C21-150M6 TaxID=3434355 RepID=UPI003D7FD3CA
MPRQEGETGQSAQNQPPSSRRHQSTARDLTARHFALFRVLALTVLLGIATAVVLFLLTEVRAKLRDLASSPRDNIQWTFAQFEVEYLEFALALNIAATPSDKAPEPTELTNLRRRYDILYSRLQTMRESAIYQEAFDRAGTQEIFQDVADEIQGMSTTLDLPDAAVATELEALQRRVAPLRDTTRYLMTRGNQALAIMSDAQRSQIAVVLQRLAIATTFLLFVLAAFAVQFRRIAARSDTQLQENLAVSAELESIFNTSRDGIAVIDGNGILISANRAAMDMFGRTEDLLLGRRIGVIVRQTGAEQSPPVTGRDLFQAARTGRTSGMRLTAIHRNGAEFPVEMSLGLSSGHRRTCVCVIRDITHQIAAETELLDSRDRARAAERAKARFLGTVSHEMRTPLNGIMGAIELISKASETDDRIATTLAPYLPVLRASSESLLTLVEDVLDITQIERGLRLNVRRFCLETLLKTQVRTASIPAREQGNSITLDTGGIGYVRGDPDRLRQVIANLLSNAVKFTQNGEISLEVSRQAGDQVEIRLSDTGFGMTEDETSRIFDDFFRSNVALDRQIPGTGLGLGITRNIIHAMGGTINVESIAGEGTVFWLTLDLPEETALEEAPAPAPLLPATTTPARLMLVEDNETNRFIARQILENDGHHVTEARNGAQAVDLAATHAFDLILMDVSMPVMDGIEAARQIRDQQNGCNRQTRIVALTAHIDSSLVETGAAEVMDAILHKPLNKDQLRAEIALVTAAPAPQVATPVVTADVKPAGDLIRTLGQETASQIIPRMVQEIDSTLPRLLSAKETGSARDMTGLADACHDLAGVAAYLNLSALHTELVRAEMAFRSALPAEEPLARASAAWDMTRGKLIDAVETRAAT